MSNFYNTQNVYIHNYYNWDDEWWEDDEQDDEESLYALNDEIEESDDSEYDPESDSKGEDLSDDKEDDEESSSVCSLDEIDQEELDNLEEEAEISILDLGRAYRLREQ